VLVKFHFSVTFSNSHFNLFCELVLEMDPMAFMWRIKWLVRYGDVIFDKEELFKRGEFLTIALRSWRQKCFTSENLIR